MSCNERDCGGCKQEASPPRKFTADEWNTLYEWNRFALPARRTPVRTWLRRALGRRA